MVCGGMKEENGKYLKGGVEYFGGKEESIDNSCNHHTT